MAGPTNTTPRYRPPPPGVAPPPPPPAENGMMQPQQQQQLQQQYPNNNNQQSPYSYAQQQSYTPMGGQGQAPNSFHQAQMQHQFNTMPHQMPPPQQQQQQQQIANQSTYQQSHTPSYYSQPPVQQTQQQQQQQQQPTPPRPTPAQGSYASRSIAQQQSNHGSTHGSTSPSNNNSNNNISTTAHTRGIDPAYLQEQSRLLNLATRKVSDASGLMNRAMEENDAVGVLEMACTLLEELGDPNHGVKGQVRQMKVNVCVL